MRDAHASSPHMAAAATSATSSHLRHLEERTLRNNASVSTSATTNTTNTTLSSSLGHREPQPRRKIPVYVRIVQKDIWLRLHVHPNGTIGSIKDLALQKANAPQLDPAQFSYFYSDAVNVSAATKMILASAPHNFSRFRSDLFPKSFVAPCPKPAPSLPRLGARSFEAGSLSSQTLGSGVPPAASARSRWKEKVGVLHSSSSSSSSSSRLRYEEPGPPRPDATFDLPAQRPAAGGAPAPSEAASAARTLPTDQSHVDVGETGSQRQRSLHDVPGDTQTAVADVPRHHQRTSSVCGASDAVVPSPAVGFAAPRNITPDASVSARQPTDNDPWDVAGSTTQLSLDPFAGGNAEAKEEEARALARLSGWSRSVPLLAVSSRSSAGRRSIDEAISALASPNSALQSPSAKLHGAKGDLSRANSYTDDRSTSDDEPIDSSLSRIEMHPVLACPDASQSSHSLAETASSEPSVNVLTTAEVDRLWGTQLEERLLTDQQKGTGLAGGASRPVTSPSDRSRSRTVTAADVGRAPNFDSPAPAAVAPAPHQRMSSVPSTDAMPLRSATSQTFVSDATAASPVNLLAHVSSQSPTSLTSPTSLNSPQSGANRAGGASSPWLDRGRLAGINLDEVSQWREATHGASDRFSIYSFSNGLMLEDWKTVAAYKLRSFELLELQSSSPVERVHLTHDVTGTIREVTRHARPSPSPQPAALEPYYEGWVYVLKPSSTSTRHSAGATIGTWKLRWVTIRGWKMDIFRKKAKPGESSTPASACFWHLSLIKWVTSEKIDSGAIAAATPPLPALEHIPPYSLTIAFSAAAWAAAMPSEFTLPTSGSSITIRCITKYDHDALYNVLNRAHFRTASRNNGSADLMQLVDGWRSNAVTRATIAGRGGTVQPGRLARTKGGRNALARTRLRPSGWPLDWEDADRWSSSSEAEEVLPSDLIWQGDLGSGALAKAARTASEAKGSSATGAGARKSLEVEKLLNAASAHGLRAVYLQQQKPQQQANSILASKRSSLPLKLGTPPSTLDRRSKLGQAVGDAGAGAGAGDPEMPLSQPGAATDSAKPPPAATQVSPHLSRGFSLSRAGRSKASTAEPTAAATPSGSRRSPKMPTTDSPVQAPNASGASTPKAAQTTTTTTTTTMSSASPGIAASFRPGSSGRSRVHTISSSTSNSPSRQPAVGVVAAAAAVPLRRFESRRTSSDLKRGPPSAATNQTSGAANSGSGGGTPPTMLKQDIPTALFPPHFGAGNKGVPRSVALLKRLKQRSVGSAKSRKQEQSVDGEGRGEPRSNSPVAGR